MNQYFLTVFLWGHEAINNAIASNKSALESTCSEEDFNSPEKPHNECDISIGCAP